MTQENSAQAEQPHHYFDYTLDQLTEALKTTPQGLSDAALLKRHQLILHAAFDRIFLDHGKRTDRDEMSFPAVRIALRAQSQFLRSYKLALSQRKDTLALCRTLKKAL